VIRLKRALVFVLVHGAEWVRKALVATPRGERFLRPGFEPLLWRIGTWRMWLAVEQARKHVPAYGRLLSEHGDPRVRVRGLVPDFSALPTTDKESYVLRFSTEERCRHGRIPTRGVWLVVHLWYLIGFQNRLLVLIRWSFSFATHGRGARLITGASTTSEQRDG
jgi:hypothetical protein